MKYKTGLCSISFRGLNAQELVRLVKQAGLDAIEWGSDVHVPFGEGAVAREVRKVTEDAGLEVSSYGSYWKVVDEKGAAVPFEPVLESAKALGTDTIRVWAGHQPSDGLSSQERATLVAHLRQATEMAAAEDVRLGLEFHANTLSDSNGATQALLREVEHPNLYTYWQPIYWLTDPEYRLRGLRELADRVLNLHVFQWMFRPGAGSWGESTDRRPLEEGAKEWEQYLKVPLGGDFQRYALMEFVRNDDPDQFLKDASVLKDWVR
ncbi:TIM barrel protein [Pelagicoccus sp. SDUM812005]|uniref:sugar phosphate isomerase/epimerase family protein n=1 Tax=Pelagicoccus sp. SDUM812005 TaxID=3041257 RepID=UPI00280D49A4|nr:TIM barrel protein [Pelagicoccus sp. SDUM812005]MDQ8183463.1 TIM barrel protein [Pelagicoccus sp. SDUM812005]